MPRLTVEQTRKLKSRSQPIESPLPAVPASDPPIDGPSSPAVATAEPPKPKSPKKKPEPRKPSQPSQPSQQLTGAIVRERALAASRDELIFRRHALLAAGQDLPPGEMKILQIARPTSPHINDFNDREQFGHALGREDNRVQTVLGLQAAAGTPNDRQAADKLAEKTAGELAKQGPGVEGQISDLQSQLGDLHMAATSAKSAADAKHDALASLRDEKLLPTFIQEELAAFRRECTDAFGRELLLLETKQTELRAVLVLDVGTPTGRDTAKRRVSGLARFGPDEYSRLEAVFSCTTSPCIGGTSFRVGAIRPEAWQGYCADLRGELADVESRITEIAGGRQAEADREVEVLKSFYVLT